MLSGKASEIARQLCLAAIAVVWLFRIGSTPGPFVDQSLLRAAFFIFVALFFDFLQYLLGTVIWYGYFRYKERLGAEPDDQFLAPAWLNWPTWALFALKMVCTFIAYLFFIIPFLARRFVG